MDDAPPHLDRPIVVSACDIFLFVGMRVACKDTYRKVSGRLPAIGDPVRTCNYLH